MILIFRDNDEVLQSTDYDEEALLVESRNGSLIYRFEPSFYRFERYHEGQWIADIPFSRLTDEG